jgi:5-methylcytosine-specific restriction endonuclease McrA
MARNEFSIGLSSSNSIFGGNTEFGRRKESNERDSRRTFTQSPKNNTCAKCKEHLDMRVVQFDHAKPWAAGGRTISENGRALCANCHAKVTNETNVKKADGKKKPKRSNNPLQISMPSLKIGKLF